MEGGGGGGGRREEWVVGILEMEVVDGVVFLVVEIRLEFVLWCWRRRER